MHVRLIYAVVFSMYYNPRYDHWNPMLRLTPRYLDGHRSDGQYEPR